MNHTPEPWEAIPPTWDCASGRILGPKEADLGKPIIGFVSRVLPNNQYNAERIVECVNACAGIENPSAIRSALDALNELLLEFEKVGWTGRITQKEARKALMSVDSKYEQTKVD